MEERVNTFAKKMRKVFETADVEKGENASPFYICIKVYLVAFLMEVIKTKCCHENDSLFTPQILVLTHQQQTTFENIVGKGEIARNEQFLFLPQCFQLNQITVYHITTLVSHVIYP